MFENILFNTNYIYVYTYTNNFVLKGTSACLNGRFFCDNIGSVGHFIPSSKVNDGVCGNYRMALLNTVLNFS